MDNVIDNGKVNVKQAYGIAVGAFAAGLFLGSILFQFNGHDKDIQSLKDADTNNMATQKEYIDKSDGVLLHKIETKTDRNAKAIEKVHGEPTD
jgi:hypothetical protein